MTLLTPYRHSTSRTQHRVPHHPPSRLRGVEGTPRRVLQPRWRRNTRPTRRSPAHPDNRPRRVSRSFPQPAKGWSSSHFSRPFRSTKRRFIQASFSCWKPCSIFGSRAEFCAVFSGEGTYFACTVTGSCCRRVCSCCTVQSPEGHRGDYHDY